MKLSGILVKRFFKRKVHAQLRDCMRILKLNHVIQV